MTGSPSEESVPFKQFARLFPADKFELDTMLEEAERVSEGDLVSAEDGFRLFEEHMGW